MRKLRILQIHHALYVPYLLTRGFRRLGYDADNLYYDFGGSSADLTWGADFNLSSRSSALPRQLAFFGWALTRYDVFHFWARPYMIPPLFTAFARHAPLDLALLKKLGKKIAFQSDGCYPMVRPSVWKTDIDPQICHVCQTTQGDTYGFCSNQHTMRLNAAMDRYAHIRFGIGLDLDFERGAAYVFSPVDLDLWRPDIAIPPEHRVARETPNTLLIFHGIGSHAIGNRGNIKGTSWIHQAVEELRSEGHRLQLMHVERVPNKAVRFYQAQADIVVDQLLVGGGGQNARECLALGKPVLTRVHPQQHKAFEIAASPFGPVPYVATDVTNVKDNLRSLATNSALRREVGERALAFAKNVLSPEAAASRYLKLYEGLYPSGDRSS